MIRALAGHFHKDVCFLQPAHPLMTDESLQQSIQTVPNNCIVVLEDVDALFGSDRKTHSGDGGSNKAPLTFSGLLNALDGVVNPDGTVFILTTNHIDRLDPALIRPGRVDLRVEFPLSTVEQLQGLFLNFYPGEHTLANKFALHAQALFPPIVVSDQQQEDKQINDNDRKDADKKEENNDKKEEYAPRVVEETSSLQLMKNKKKKKEEEEMQRVAVSMAALQQLFIRCRKKSADDAFKYFTDEFECVRP